jgi:acyl carrier protein
MVSYGLDSVHSMMLVGDLEDALQNRFPPTLAWDYPTVEAMAEYLGTGTASEGQKTAAAGQFT